MRFLLIALWIFTLGCLEARHDPMEPQNPQRSSKALPEENPVTSRVKGYDWVNANVQQRMFKSDSALAAMGLVRYLASESNPFGGQGLTLLLGFYNPAGKSEFTNPYPNPVNSLIWHLIFDGLAKDLASLCLPPEENPFADQLKATVAEANQEFCQGQMASQKPNEELLLDYWLNTMNYDAPFTEFIAWRDFVWSEELELMPPDEFVWSINLAIFYNPYFLIKSE